MKAFNNVVLHNITGNSFLIMIFYQILFVESGQLILQVFCVSGFSLHSIISTSWNKKIYSGINIIFFDKLCFPGKHIDYFWL